MSTLVSQIGLSISQKAISNSLLVSPSKTLDSAFPVLRRLTVFPVQKRHRQTAAKLAEKKKSERSEVKKSKSFCFNAFQGELINDQVFPYPDILTGQQKEQLSHMVDHFTALGEKGTI